MKGAEPFSVKKKSDIGVLVLQGYTGTTSSVMPLAKFLAAKGYNIECPRLAGHGTQWKDLNRVHWHEWRTDVETALSRLKLRCKKIFIAGLSVGGLLTLYLAENHPDLRGIILINHALMYKDPRLFILPFLQYILPATKGVYSDIKNPKEHEIGYDHTPLKGLYQTTLLQKIVRKNLKQIKQPTIIFKSKEDHVIPIENVKLTMDNISSQDKTLIWLENSYHVATQDFDKTLIFKKSDEFIKRLCQQKKAR